MTGRDADDRYGPGRATRSATGTPPTSSGRWTRRTGAPSRTTCAPATRAGRRWPSWPGCPGLLRMVPGRRGDRPGCDAPDAEVVELATLARAAHRGRRRRTAALVGAAAALLLLGGIAGVLLGRPVDAGRRPRRRRRHRRRPAGHRPAAGAGRRPWPCRADLTLQEKGWGTRIDWECRYPADAGPYGTDADLRAGARRRRRARARWWRPGGRGAPVRAGLGASSSIVTEHDPSGSRSGCRAPTRPWRPRRPDAGVVRAGRDGTACPPRRASARPASPVARPPGGGRSSGAATRGRAPRRCPGGRRPPGRRSPAPARCGTSRRISASTCAAAARWSTAPPDAHDVRHVRVGVDHEGFGRQPGGCPRRRRPGRRAPADEPGARGSRWCRRPPVSTSTWRPADAIMLNPRPRSPGSRSGSRHTPVVPHDDLDHRVVPDGRRAAPPCPSTTSLGRRARRRWPSPRSRPARARRGRVTRAPTPRPQASIAARTCASSAGIRLHAQVERLRGLRGGGRRGR